MYAFLQGIAGAVVGALAVLLGGYFQLRAENKRQENRLAYDREQRRTDREMSLRRDIYLEAASAWANQVEYLISFGRPQITTAEQSAILKGSSAAISRVHIIGTPSTLEAFNKAQRLFALSAIDLTEGKALVDMAQFEVGRIEGEIAYLLKSSEQIMTTAREHQPNPLKPGDQEYLASLYKFSAGNIVEAQSKGKDRDRAQDVLHARQVELLKVSFQAALALQAPLFECVSAVRRELELPFENEESMKGLQANDAREMQDRFDGMMVRFVALAQEQDAKERQDE